MKEKFDWMTGLAKKNVTAAVTTAVSPVSAYLTGMTIGQMLFKAIPVMGTAAAVVSGIGYLASKQNQANLEQQTAIQQSIDKLTRERESIQQSMREIKHPEGNRKARQRYKRLASELRRVEFDLEMAEDKLETQGSTYLIKKAAAVYDTVCQAISSTVKHAGQNISDAYKFNGGGVIGLGYAVQETAKYVNQVPGVSGYAKAGLHVISGNITDGGVEAVVHSYTGLSVNLTERVVVAMAKVTSKELKNTILDSVSTVMEDNRVPSERFGYH